MRKNCRILAMFLTLTLVVPVFASEAEPPPSETTAPVAVSAPEETPAPEEIPAPGEAPASEETAVPGETPAPVETPVPEEVPPLADTPVPEESPTPEEIPVPGEAPASEETPAPASDDSSLIHVTVPAMGRIILNPYGMAVETSDGTSRSQVICETMTIANESEVPVAVSASVVGHISEWSSMEFVSAPPPPDAREKAVFLYAEFQNDAGAWWNSYKDEENQILVSAAASEEKDVLTLAAGPSEGVFRVFGATSVSPNDPWCSDDAVSVTLTFSFTAMGDASSTQTVEEPLEETTEEPTEEAVRGSEEPTAGPSEEPTEEPSGDPTVGPAEEPIGELVEKPTVKASEEPTAQPSEEPVVEPSEEPLENENQDPAPTDGEERVETDADSGSDQPETDQL